VACHRLEDTHYTKLMKPRWPQELASLPRSACQRAWALIFPSPAGADAVTNWNANAGKAALAACIAPGDDPLHESRLYATMHVAIHDALNAIDRRSRPYAFDAHGNPGASRDAAVAAAARHVLVPVIGQIPFPPASKPTMSRRSRQSQVVRPKRRVFR
jgi:hypothetical protein